MLIIKNIKRGCFIMKKFGYTLTETLVAISVIGAVAAITLPLVNSYRPDEKKIKFLNVYDAVVESTKMMISNTSMYPIIGGGEDGKNYLNVPLLNTDEVTLADGKPYGGGVKKYCELLAMSLGDNNGEVNCNNDAYGNNNALAQYKIGNIKDVSFTSLKGVDFYILTQKAVGVKQVSYQTFVLFDIDGRNEGVDCVYDADDCPNPDVFVLLVAANGVVQVEDEMGQFYLKKRHSYRLNKYVPSVDDDIDLGTGNHNYKDWCYKDSEFTPRVTSCP